MALSATGSGFDMVFRAGGGLVPLLADFAFQRKEQPRETLMSMPPASPSRFSRLGLYGPFLILGLFVALWSGVWAFGAHAVWAM